MQQFREKGSSLRIVGGAVRDCLLGLPSHDIDFCTPALPNAVLSWVEQMGWKAFPTGISFGTITVRAPTEEIFEITTLRRDIRTNGRHASVEFTTSWLEDAARRDFTINALSCDEEGHLYDFFEGQKDLEEGRIRFIGHPQTRIQEDYLRILRYFRFWARFGKEKPEPSLISLLERLAPLLNNLSGERLWKELQGILVLPHFGESLWFMRRILAPLLGITFPQLVAPTLWTHPLLQDPILRLGFWISSGTACQGVSQRLRFSRAEKQRFVLFSTRRTYALQKKKEWMPFLLREVPQEDCVHCFAIDIVRAVQERRLSEREAQDLLTEAARASFPSFPLSGALLLETGLPQGRAIGEILEKTRVWWAEHCGQPDKEDCLKKALQIAAS
jgi:poly(A) polymerase